MNQADKILNFIRDLPITSGDHLDEKVTVLPWQERFVRGVFRKGVQTAGLSVGRGNGKSTVVSWLASAVLFGPLNRRNAKVIVAAASFEQGGTIHRAVCDLLPNRMDKNRWSIWDSNRLRIRCKDTGAELQVLSFSPGASHGLMGATLILCDEVAQWPKGKRDAMWTALEGTLGKSPGCRLIALGTRPDSKENPFSKLLDGQADFVVEYRSRARKYWWKDTAIRRANPSLDFFPSLRSAIERDARLARRDPVKLAAFRAYRLNQGTPEAELRDAVITAESYRGLEAPGEVHIGEYILGLDLSGGHAWTGCAAVNLHPDPAGKHHVEGFACWPQSANLMDRGKRDEVDYEAMVRDGDLIILPGPSVTVDQVIAEAIGRWGRPVAVVSDYFRITESRWCLEQQGFFEDDDTFVTRRMGWFDGSADLRAFRRMAADKSLLFARSTLLRYSFSVARTISDNTGNDKLAKETERSNKGKDDVAAAVLIAAAEVHRRQLEPATAGFVVAHVPPTYAYGGY